ncbi:MAG: nucleotidyltransferase domain-containing protein [Chloroflexota bacterium]
MSKQKKLSPVLPLYIEQEIAKMKNILRRYGASKIILYGSLARGDFRGDSDIDLCYEGIPDEKFFTVLADCIMTTAIPVSIINLNDAQGYLKQRILSEGTVLYEQERTGERN